MLRKIIFLSVSLLFCDIIDSNKSSEDLATLINQVFQRESSIAYSRDYSFMHKTDEASHKTSTPRDISQTCTTLRSGLGICMDYRDCLFGLLLQNDTSFERKEYDDPCTGILNTCCPKDAVPNDKKQLLSVKSADCGISNPISDLNSQPKALNISTFGEFPWMVAVLRHITYQKMQHTTYPDDNMVTRIYQCGGSLIHPRVVMTDALCASTLNISDTLIRVGEWDTQAKSEKFPHQDMPIAKIIIHDKFNKVNMHYSIALLILESEVDLAPNVGVICLPPSVSKTPHGQCLVSGWGKDKFGNDGTYQTTLKKLEMPFVSNADCNDALKKTRLGPSFKLHSSFICAGGGDVDTCKGDAGSPLVCKLSATERQYFQYGIVSWGIACKQPGVPGVYTDVGSLRIWINQQLRDNYINMDDYTL